MTKPDPKPVERPPVGMPLPRWIRASHPGAIPYKVMAKLDAEQEDWESVARKFGVSVNQLILFNFETRVPAVVNWYLRVNTGCDKVSPSGNNWMFSHSAKPGIIWIPPADDQEFDFEPEKFCAWEPSGVKDFMMRLVGISQGMSGVKGQRIKKLVQVIVRAGDRNDLWYYNEMVIKEYVALRTDDAKRREMTKFTHGTFSFDGPSGVHGQGGTEEQHRGNWRIHAVNDLFDEFACGHWDANNMKISLESIVDNMEKGTRELNDAVVRSTVPTVVGTTLNKGGATLGTDLENFLSEVNSLKQNKTHLYSAFQ